MISNATSSRFSSLTSEEQLGDAAKGVIPNNTLCITQAGQRITSKPGLLNVTDCVLKTPSHWIYSSHDAKLVCKNLCWFVMETQREDGKSYPLASLRCLLSALNRILQDNRAPFSVFDKKDPHFRDLMHTLDSVSSELHRKGIGAQRKSASVITFKDENVLWERGLLGDDSPRVLQHTVFYYAGMQFCLWCIQEQYDMR